MKGIIAAHQNAGIRIVPDSIAIGETWGEPSTP
jgi:hypothetical protein